jgi:penicillin-binding protein 1A
MAQMYSVFANGGFRVDPYFIARVDTDGGKTVFQATPPTACIDCEVTDKPSEGTAKRVISPKTHYMMNSMLRDVVRMGTAKKALALGRSDVAGKTGTTNNFFDAWFDGYTPALVTVAWFGYDTYKTLGRGMMGGDLALPMWVKFMRVALKDVPEYTFPVPSGGRAKKIRVGKKGTTTDYEFYSKGSRFVDEEKTSPGSHKRKSGAAKAGQDKEKPVSKPRSSGKSSTRSIESLF